MESFKESGSIEYTSDILMGLEYTNKITSNDRDYEAKKNPRKHTEKFEFRKYDPVARKHVIFKETKIK